MLIGTNEISEKYSITRHNLNILIEHDPEFVGYLGMEKEWNGQVYINKHVFKDKEELTEEKVNKRLLEIKAKIKADKKANTKDRDIIEARKRTLNRHNRKYINEIAEFTSVGKVNQYNKDCVYKEILERVKELCKVEDIDFKLDKQKGTVRILKSNNFKFETEVYKEKYNRRVFDEIPYYCLTFGEEIEMEEILITEFSIVEIVLYKYEINNELVGTDYKIISVENKSKEEVLEVYTDIFR